MIYGFSEVSDGDMRANTPGFAARREAFWARLGIDPTRVVVARQTHRNKAVVVNSLADRERMEEADALVTKQPDLYLAVLMADCLPILLYDAKNQVVAAVHAGWRGIASRIIEQTVKTMINEGAQPSHIQGWIGPHIKVDHYKLLPNSASYPLKVAAFGLAPTDRFLDLTIKAVRQLEEQGVDVAALEIGECTACHETKYFSYSQSAGVGNGLMMAVIGVGSGSQA